MASTFLVVLGSMVLEVLGRELEGVGEWQEVKQARRPLRIRGQREVKLVVVQPRG